MDSVRPEIPQTYGSSAAPVLSVPDILPGTTLPAVPSSADSPTDPADAPSVSPAPGHVLPVLLPEFSEK